MNTPQASQLKLTKARGFCSRVDCDEPAAWMVTPGPTFHCDEHIKPYFTHAQWQKWLKADEARISKL